MTLVLTLPAIEDLAARALLASGVAEVPARSVARSVAAAEADGIHSHGLGRLPTYCAHAACGKIDGTAVPSIEVPVAGTVRADARSGFAHPAIDAGLPPLLDAARANGVAMLAVDNSYNCGVVGYHVERIAEAGFVALGFVNAPASIAPWGGREALFGTNPIALAAPGPDGTASVVIDQASSVIAKSEIVVHQREGTPIPTGWALDRAGQPTTDPQAALDGGTMVPAGGHKGAGLALLVEIMAAAVTGATLGRDASSFATNEGGSPRTGQLFLAIDADASSGNAYGARMAALLAAFEGMDGVRIPGSRRRSRRAEALQNGVAVPEQLIRSLERTACR